MSRLKRARERRPRVHSDIPFDNRKRVHDLNIGLVPYSDQDYKIITLARFSLLETQKYWRLKAKLMEGRTILLLLHFVSVAPGRIRPKSKGSCYITPHPKSRDEPVIMTTALENLTWSVGDVSEPKSHQFKYPLGKFTSQGVPVLNYDLDPRDLSFNTGTI